MNRSPESGVEAVNHMVMYDKLLMCVCVCVPVCLPALGECTPQSEAFQQRCFLHFLVAAASGTYSVCACVCVFSCFNLEYQCFSSCAEVQDTFSLHV